MKKRNDYIHELLTQIDDMITSIEDREVDEPDFVEVREMTENLREEVDALQEN